MYCSDLNHGRAACADPTNRDGNNAAAATAAPDTRNDRRLRSLLSIVCSFSTREAPFNSAPSMAEPAPGVAAARAWPREYYEIRDDDQTIGAAGIRRHASPAQPPGAN